MQNKPKTTTERFYNDIIRWYHACQYPQALIDDIMKYHQPDTLGPYLQATPETIARVCTKALKSALLTFPTLERK